MSATGSRTLNALFFEKVNISPICGTPSVEPRALLKSTEARLLSIPKFSEKRSKENRVRLSAILAGFSVMLLVPHQLLVAMPIIRWAWEDVIEARKINDNRSFLINVDFIFIYR